MFFILPIPPSLNHAFTTNRFGQRVLKRNGKLWTEEARAIAFAASVSHGWELAEKEKVVLEIMTFWPDNRIRDVSNLGKILYDALEGIVYDNDRYCLPRYINWEIDRHNPRLEITVRRLGDEGEESEGYYNRPRQTEMGTERPEETVSTYSTRNGRVKVKRETKKRNKPYKIV